MRLIDTDKIGLTDFEIVMCESSYENALSILLNKIFNAPTVDAIPVIRCKDCIHKPKDHNYCWSFEKFVVDDFFCAEGERRKE